MKLSFKKKEVLNGEITNKGIVTKKFFNKKIISLIAAVLIIVVGVGLYKYKFSKPKTTQSKVKYATLAKTDIKTTINASAAIKSGDSTNIYSNLQYNVSSINVEVGDVVKKGDVLATIDTTTLEEEIAEAQQTLNANKVKNQASLTQAQKNYDNAKYLYDNNLNTNIVNAETSLNKDKLALEDYKKTLDYNKAMLENGSLSQHEVDTAQMNCDNAQKAVEQDEVTLEAAKVTAQKEIENYKAALDSAQAVVDNKTDELALQDKQKKLKDSQVVATVDGTITNVNCEVGVEASGALFVIKDLGNLIVDTDVDETDVNNIVVGQNAELSTDASGSEIIHGTVTTVEPVSVAASASTDYSSSSKSSSSTSSTTSSDTTSSDVTFRVEIQLSGQSDKVKVGMNSTVKIITNEADNVYAVPYTAVLNNNGQSVIYVAVKEGNKYVVKEIPVTKGLESDINVAIDGADLIEGMIVLTEPSNYKVGDTVTIK